MNFSNASYSLSRWAVLLGNIPYFGIESLKSNYFGTTLFTDKNIPLSNYELEGIFWYGLII
jgi:hypothetical protein